MKASRLILILFTILYLSCNKDRDLSVAEQIKNKEITIIGNPDSSLLAQYLSDTVSFKYILNSMMTIDVIVEDTGAYHCFIMENVDNQKQLSYFILDDAIKYNYIPYYDSLEYDLSLTSEQIANYGLKWSSKFEQIPYLRTKSSIYQELVATCDDDKDLSSFYNNSLFFQSQSTNDKKDVLTKLIEITQTQLVGKYLRFKRPYKNLIIFGLISSWDSYNILKFKHLKRWCDYYLDINEYTGTIFSFNLKDWLQELEKRLTKGFSTINKEVQYVKYSSYLLQLQKENLQFINQNMDEIISKEDSCDIMICVDYKYSDSRIFFFNINTDMNNKITITKNYYNKEFLPTTRMSNYYLYY